MNLCLICATHQATDGQACPACVDTLVTSLHMVAWLAAELAVTTARQDRPANRTGGSDGDPLPINLGAAAAGDALRATMLGWAHAFNAEPLVPTVGAIVTWLIARPDHLRRHPAVDQLADDLKRHQDKALEIINPPDDVNTYGICGAEYRKGQFCPAHLYGEGSWVTCRRCGASHDTRKRQEWMRRRMESLYFRASTLARVLPRLIERPVSASGIRSWAFRGRPIRTIEDPAGHTTYHCGDVIAVAIATPTRTREPKAG